ncbi:hypothetical protein DYU11_19025 [Fibrisoma montanum]|uniref:Uncharacterized protein n=1 Tax=Fibrisoma montanum TaxID=2305895 RepID=A0A418M6S3_9BACT|nr:hypothetical protein [Fibrisoma montanum]RIV21496.1 hypothetical protein DYU11_19025 [Fibrisoma montanum]
MTINDLFSDLPEHDPDENLWARVSANLDADERLTKAINDLPHYEPKADLWSSIERELSSEAGSTRGPAATETPVVPHPATADQRGQLRPLWGWVAAAAAVFLAVGFWLTLPLEADEQIRVEYAVETASPTPTTALPESEPTSADERAEAFIAQQCLEQRFVCQRPEVHELRNQLTDLNAERERIEKERLTFGDDPALIKAQIRVENQRAEVTKELITLLRS